jgi:hypothetical protein
MSDEKHIPVVSGSTAFGGPFTEPLVARVSGVKKSVLAHARRTRLVQGEVATATAVEGRDWFLDERQQVIYSRAGLAKLLTGLGIDFASLDWTSAASAKSPVKATSERIENKAPIPTGGATETPTMPTNPRIEASVGAPAPEKSAALSDSLEKFADLTVLRVTGPHRLTARGPGGVNVALSVQRSENFIRGMVVPGCRRSGESGLWTFTGRLPRRRGKW